MYMYFIYLLFYLQSFSRIQEGRSFLFLRSKNLILNRIKQDHNPNALKNYLFSYLDFKTRMPKPKI